MIDKFSEEYRFLSNFYPCIIEFEGIVYPSNEHYYVAMKFNDEQIYNNIHYTVEEFRIMISEVVNPGRVKKIGQNIKVRDDWDSIKLDIMNFGIREKFKDDDLKNLLLSTGNKKLIEGNVWKDTFWGVYNNNGKNHLGRILMQVRREIRIEKNGGGLESIFNL